VKEKFKLLQIKEEFVSRNAIFMQQVSSLNKVFYFFIKEDKSISNSYEKDITDIEIG